MEAPPPHLRCFRNMIQGEATGEASVSGVPKTFGPKRGQGESTEGRRHASVASTGDPDSRLLDRTVKRRYGGGGGGKTAQEGNVSQPPHSKQSYESIIFGL